MLRNGELFHPRFGQRRDLSLTEAAASTRTEENTMPQGSSSSACPSRETIWKYQASQLDDETAEGVESHLAECETCAATAMGIQKEIEDDELGDLDEGDWD